MLNAELRKVLRSLIVTEKSSQVPSGYVFEVDMNATKKTIKKAVEAIFNVSVVSVNTLITKKLPRQSGRQQRVMKYAKKAYIKIVDGQEIQFESLDK